MNEINSEDVEVKVNEEEEEGEGEGEEGEEKNSKVENEEEKKSFLEILEDIFCYNPLVSSIRRIINNCKTISIFSWILLGVTIIQALTTAVAAIGNQVMNLFFDRYGWGKSYSSLIEGCAIFAAIGVVLYFAFDAILNENEFQLIALSITITALTVTTGMVLGAKCFGLRTQFLKVFTAFSTYYLTILLLAIFVLLVPLLFMILLQCVYLILLIPVFRSFGWKIFESVGTNPDIIRMYKFYTYNQTFIKADICFTLIGFILFFFFQTVNHEAFIAFQVVFLLLSVALPFLSNWAVKKEISIIQVAFIIWCYIGPIYYIAEILLIVCFNERALKIPIILNWMGFVKLQPIDFGMWKIEQPMTNVIMVVLCSASIFFRVCVIVTSTICLFNFNKGLKQIFAGQEKKNRKRKKSKKQTIQDLLN